ncbi:MAG: DUF3943 domain-containing protein [Deltaproteobacteria bacterium]|nr:DUF3943 domain-containing protein [Deltaproteobacteria bacterium]TLN03267.1 MAG: DUF3943 domain-containing protein [bacterium]
MASPHSHGAGGDTLSSAKTTFRNDTAASGAEFMNLSSAKVRIINAPSGATPAVVSPPSILLAEESTPDWSGIWRDTGLLAGSQIGAVAITYVLPESFSNWSKEKKGQMFRNYGKHFVDPVIDDDKFYVNYILHPYWGSTYYIRARERGLSKKSSLVYSAMMSAMYEFGVECIFEKPSIQDLIVTPGVGSLLGAFVFEPLRDRIKSKPNLHWYDHAVLVVTDPIGVLSTGFEKLFGIKSNISLTYLMPEIPKPSVTSSSESNEKRVGINMKFLLK